MSKELKIKGALGKDYQQIYVEDQPTNLFINNEGKIRSKFIKKDVLDKVLIFDPDKIIVKASTIHLDGTTDITLKETSSKIRIVDPASSNEKLEIYHSADDVIFAATDSTNIVIDSGDGQYTEFWYNGALRERISGAGYQHAFHYDSNNYFGITLAGNLSLIHI